MGYKPELDAMRGISILIVIFSHAGLGHLIPGTLGVTVFFIISGYLITSLLLAEHAAIKHIDLFRFYMRRFWRLLPPLFLFIVFSVASIVWVNKAIKLNEIASAVFYYSNYYKVLVHYDPLNGHPSPFGILWSLSIEEHFYILYAPLLAYTIATGRYIQVTYLMLILPLIIRILIVTLLPELLIDGGYNYAATETRIDSIAAGCLLAIMFHAKSVSVRAKSLLLNDSTTVLALAILMFTLLDRSLFFRETFRYSLQNVAIFILLANLLFSNSTYIASVKKALSNNLLIHIGKLSYSLYLFHWLALVYAHLGTGGFDRLNFAWQILFWPLTIGLTYFSYYFIELKLKRYRYQYGSHAN